MKKLAMACPRCASEAKYGTLFYQDEYLLCTICRIELYTNETCEHDKAILQTYFICVNCKTAVYTEDIMDKK